jgi:hypothetical protein
MPTGPAPERQSGPSLQVKQIFAGESLLLSIRALSLAREALGVPAPAVARSVAWLLGALGLFLFVRYLWLPGRVSVASGKGPS